MNNLLAFTTDSEIELASQRIPPSFMDVSKLLVRATFEFSTPKTLRKSRISYILISLPLPLSTNTIPKGNNFTQYLCLH